jgi:myo-inositol-1-phosphate synthase
MALKQGVEIKPATGKLGVLTPGMGAVATTYFAGNLSIRKGLTPPVGSLCELGTIRLGKRTDNNTPKIRDYVPLAQMSDLVFGGWDPIPDNAYEAAVRAGVLEAKHLEPIREELSAIKPMPAVFDQQWVKRLDGPNKKTGTSKMHLAEQVMEDIKSFQAKHGCDRMVLIWCGSTEVYRKPSDVHSSLAKFEAGLRASDDNIAPSQIYAYAALKLGIPYANGAPNLAVDTEALMELARENHVPIAGKDFKTGQTLMKTILAPGFKARMLGLQGWYSTNILGNRDGEVLDDPESFKSKEVTKLGVIDQILQPEKYPSLYGNVSHVVRINYYPPRGDNKEGWDNIDIFGWLGYPMQIKVNFLCRDSILSGADRPRPRPVHGLRQARRPVRHPGVAVVLLEEPADRRPACTRARPVHPAHEAEEHAALPEG